jgi:hypothetical protein
MRPNQIYYQVGMPDIHPGYGFRCPMPPDQIYYAMAIFQVSDWQTAAGGDAGHPLWVRFLLIYTMRPTHIYYEA